MDDDTQAFHDDLTSLIANLRMHAQRRIAIYDQMGVFLRYVADKDAEFERMVGHFMPPPHPLPHTTTHTDQYQQQQSYQNGADRDPVFNPRLNEALGRHGNGHD